MRLWLLLLGLSLTAPLAAEEAGASTATSPLEVLRSRPCGDSLCHDLEIRCGGIAAREARVRETEVEAPRGAVVFATGVFGSQAYDHYPERKATLEATREAGLETFEIQWGGGRQGWGRGAAGAGYANALCGTAEIVRWIAAERADRPSRLCAQGNSGAALQLAYGLAVFGLEDTLDLAVLSGGPPLVRAADYCFGRGRLPKEKRWKDNGRRMTDFILGFEGQGDFCKEAHSTAEARAAMRTSDLVTDAAPRDLSYERTRLVFLQAERDKSTAQARIFYEAVTSEKTWRLLPGGRHGVDREPATAPVVRDTLIAECLAAGSP